LRNPRGLFITANLTIYIADTSNHRIQRWDLGRITKEINYFCFYQLIIVSLQGAASGVTVAGESGVSGSYAYQLSNPEALLFDQYGNMYILDVGNDRIQRWRPGATYGVTIVSATMSSPRGLAMDSSGNLVTADYGYHRVDLFAAYCRTSKLLYFEIRFSIFHFFFSTNNNNNYSAIK